MADKAPALKPKKEGHKVYTFLHDYPLGGKRKGDQVSLPRVPTHLQDYFAETARVKTPKKAAYKGDIPTDKSTKDQIIQFLHSNGVTDTNGLAKDDLLMMVQPFYDENDE